jgi:hypothetical protein
MLYLQGLPLPVSQYFCSMVKKSLSYVLLAALLIFTAIMAWKFMRKLDQVNHDPLDAVPATSSVAVKLNHPLDLWKQLSGSSMIWSELRGIQPFSEIHGAGLTIDSLVQRNKDFAAFALGQSLVIALHPAGNDKSDVLCVFKDKENSREEIFSLFEACTGKKIPEGRSYKSHEIFQVQLGSGKWEMIQRDGHLILASSTSLAESVHDHLDEGKSITSEKGWSNVYQTTDPETDANIYINHSHFTQLLNQWINPAMRELLARSQPYAYFSGLDLKISSATISLNGFSFAPDSVSFFLNVFGEHQPQTFSGAKYLPDNTAGFLWLGVNDGESFLTSIEKWMGKNGTLQEHSNRINQFNSDFDCNIRQQLISWIGNEIILFSNATDDSASLNEHLFLAIRINDLVDPYEELQSLAAKLDTSGNSTTEINGIELGQLKADNLFSMLFGELFAGIDQPYFMRVEDYIVFCNSSTQFLKYLQDISSDRSLGKNITYFNFVSENLAEKANVTVYANPSKLRALLLTMLDPGKANQLGEGESLISRFNAFAWQLSSAGKGLFYNNLYLKYNGEGKQDSKSLWEIAADTTISAMPMLIHNHITNTEDVVVQDDNYTVYFISSKGELLWKKALEEKVVGTYKQIDYFGNGKLQLLFTTHSQLHLIDLKGNYMNGFPVKLPSEVTGEMGVFDYESNFTYRILIPSGNKIINVDKDGKITTGWEFEGTTHHIKEAPVFFRAENKDYIFVCDVQGEMHAIDRKGKTRYHLNHQLKGRSSNEVILVSGSNIENTSVIYSDSSGRIIKLFFNGNADTAKTGRRSPYHKFAIADIDADGNNDVIVLDSGKVDFVSWSGKALGSYNLSIPINQQLFVYTLKDKTVLTGISSPQTGELLLLLPNGLLHPRFPLEGTTGFIVRDINGDGSLELVSGTGTRRIVCYSFNL